MSGTVDRSYPILPFGIVACSLIFFWRPFLEIAVYVTVHSTAPTPYLYPKKQSLLQKSNLFYYQKIVIIYNPPKSHQHHWFPRKMTSEKWVHKFLTDVACKQALWGALGVGGSLERACSYSSGIWILPPISLWLPINRAVRFLTINAKRKQARMWTSIEKHIDLRNKLTYNRYDIITDVISANQHFASTFLMQIFQRRSCKLSFLFLSCCLSALGCTQADTNGTSLPRSG